LIYLKASPENQLKRINMRNRRYELQVDLDYLVNLREQIDLLIEREIARGQAIVEIDTDNIFMANHHTFAAQLAVDIESRLQFCINPSKGNIPSPDILYGTGGWR